MKRLLLFALSAALILAAVPCCAANNDSVTINKKTLAQIDDIVMETAGTRTIIKGSFLKFYKEKYGAFKFITNYSSANLDGTDVKLTENKSYETGHAAGKTNTGIHPVLGKKRTSDGKLVVVFPATESSGKEKLFINSLKVAGKLDDHSITNESYHYHSATGELSNLYISDSASGLFPENNDGREVFAITYFIAKGGKRPGFSQAYDAYICLFDAEKNTSKVHSLGTMNASFPSVRVAAGDFDNDGKENELAVITDGGNADYWMRVFRISGLELGNAFYSVSLGARENTEADNSDGCDVVAGDFNNDGKTEFAAVYADFKDTSSFANPGGDYFPTVTTFSWNGSTFTQKSKTDQNDSFMLGSTHWTRSSYVPHFGVIAEAADIDGNGTDDIVFLTASYGGGEGNIVVSVWDTDNSLNPSRKCYRKTSKKIAGFGGTTGIDMAECSYLPRSLSLGLVPMGDKSDGKSTHRIFVTRAQGGDSIKDSSDYRTGDEIFYMTVTNSKGSVNSLSDLTLWKSGSSGYAAAIVPGDFFAESVELGEPVHMMFENERSYAAEVQATPYHVDYVQVDFPVNGTVPSKPSVLNMTYTGSSVTYEKSEADSQKKDTSFGTASTFDWGVNANASGQYKLVGASVSGGYKDTSSRVENNTKSSEAKLTTAVNTLTKGSDNLVIYVTDRHVWRYPVLNFIDIPNVEGLTGEKFMTFSLCDIPKIVQGSAGQSQQFDDYQPSHEEGNLFSYPTMIENIPYYSARQHDLSKTLETTIGGQTESSATLVLAISDLEADVSSLTTKSKKAVNGSVGVTIGVPKIMNAGATATASYASELTNTDTFTKSYMQSEKFTVALLDNALGFTAGNIAHLIKTKLYADAAGIMKAGFAVDLRDSNALVWRDDGMYGKKPDIALVLPARFGREVSVIDNVTRIVWKANYDRISALQTRGVWFWDDNADSWTTSTLVRGGKYKVKIPVYNASFKAPDQPVTIQMRLRNVAENEGDDKDFGLLDTKTFTIGGWTRNTENNKAEVSFDWTVPNNLSGGNYDLYFVVDPNNMIDELHENWNYTTDPGGNNIGRFPIAILEKAPEKLKTAGAFHASAVSESDFAMYFKPLRNNDTRSELTFEEFRKEAANMTSDFRTHARIVYSGSETLTNCWLNVARTDPDGTENRIAFRTIPAIFPKTESTASFMVSPENIKNGTFNLDIYGDGVSLHWSSDASNDDDNSGNNDDNGGNNNGGNDNNSSGSGGSSGCSAGFTACALVILAAVIRRKH